MGFGDVTLMGMIGAFLGWQAAVLTFFAGAFFGLAHAVWKLSIYVRKWMRGEKLSTADRELPFGPYLSMGAARPGPELDLALARLLPASSSHDRLALLAMLGVNVPFPN